MRAHPDLFEADPWSVVSEVQLPEGAHQFLSAFIYVSNAAVAGHKLGPLIEFGYAPLKVGRFVDVVVRAPLEQFDVGRSFATKLWFQVGP